ncbi:MAG: hypothetical protein ACRD68_03895 [Pyrinomonadaceae bacterium]
MRFLLFLWAAVEVLQIVVIGILVASHRKLQRQIETGEAFARRPPRSVTDE